MERFLVYLLDTNIFLEVLLEQKNYQIVNKFLEETDSKDINISDLSFHSIGFFLFKRNKKDLFLKLARDIETNNTNILNLSIRKYQEIKFVSENFNLDFDDSYQYLIAKTYSLVLVTFDKHFDKTDIKRFELK